ncbi:ABC transporter ATP-binding protein [Litchfieldella rifensis]|uniref:ABC transporter ATP-binding protein n=1 Tax=Litchfieldella rifensis TaxID=762643 RepID=A0ABV7LUC6_9GAMM
MYKSIKSLYFLLTKEQRKKLLWLQVLVVIMSFAQIASVISIGPFMAIVGDMSRLEGQGVLARLYQGSGLSSPFEFLFWLGIVVLVVLIMAAIVSMYTTWRMCMYGAKVGADISNRLFNYYMQQPWLFHVGGSSSTLTKQIAQECQRVSTGIIKPLMEMNAKLVLSVMMALAIFLYNPVVAIAGLLIFSFSYFILYISVRRRLIKNGRLMSKIQTFRFNIMAEGFGGIKDTLVLGRQKSFIYRFSRTSDEYANAYGITQALGQVPSYAMELIAFGSIIFLVLYLLSVHEGSLGHILPILSVYALAGFKMLPAFQQVYRSISSIRSNIAAFEAIHEDLKASYGQRLVARDSDGEPESTPPLTLNHSIALRNIIFQYPGKDSPALNGLTIDISANKVVGLVGSSGSGKSTAVDILLGLFNPDSGQVLIDGKPLYSLDDRVWKNTVGYVPQSIFLADATIRENIAFGLPPEKINEDRVKKAASLAHLDELLESLSRGLNTRVGERGVQLSGGQRQRIGIARALYCDASVLILDEATSALDGITEKMIMDAIHDLSGSKTIVMIAHRLATVSQCDCIYLMVDGRVVDKGSYEELVGRNEIFQRMAQHV